MAVIRLGQVSLELMEPVGPDTSWREFLETNGEGVQRIAFGIRDLDKTVKRSEGLGMPVVHRGRYDADNGTYIYLDSKRALGVTLELLHSDPKKQKWLPARYRLQ
jgi:methylmalonyl-CoA/ethylmalonyl-CoA epimerase